MLMLLLRLLHPAFFDVDEDGNIIGLDANRLSTDVRMLPRVRIANNNTYWLLDESEVIKDELPGILYRDSAH